MNNDLEVFENRSDDWLAKERKYEASVSAWDLDEGIRLKAEHEENCEAEDIKRKHHTKHEYYNNTHDRGVVNDNNQFQTVDASIVKRFIIVMILIGLLFTMFGVAAEFGIIGDEFGFAIPIIIFILLVNLTTVKKGGKK